MLEALEERMGHDSKEELSVKRTGTTEVSKTGEKRGERAEMGSWNGKQDACLDLGFSLQMQSRIPVSPWESPYFCATVPHLHNKDNNDPFSHPLSCLCRFLAL